MAHRRYSQSLETWRHSDSRHSVRHRNAGQYLPGTAEHITGTRARPCTRLQTLAVNRLATDNHPHLHQAPLWNPGFFVFLIGESRWLALAVCGACNTSLLGPSGKSSAGRGNKDTGSSCRRGTRPADVQKRSQRPGRLEGRSGAPQVSLGLLADLCSYDFTRNDDFHPAIVKNFCRRQESWPSRKPFEKRISGGPKRSRR